MKLVSKISWLLGRVQKSLFPHLEECFDSDLTDQEKRLVTILEIIQAERFVAKCQSGTWRGRKPHDRQAIARAFVAKTLYRFGTTIDLIQALRANTNLRRICGFVNKRAIPSEATFSRSFAEFAGKGLGSIVHDSLVQEYLANELIGHISRDSTAIVGRERPIKKIQIAKKPRKRGRPAKGEQRELPPKKRLDRQLALSAPEAIQELPTSCDRGTKTNSQGYKTSWNGYKLHLDINDTGLPISALVTSASLHDSQVAIPLMKQTSSKVRYLYDLMDSAYDAKQIYQISRDLEHVPIIDKNSRGKEVIPMAPHEAQRYKTRSSVERANSRLKEDFGANNVMVKGIDKVTLHLMFGVIVLFADQLMRLLE